MWAREDSSSPPTSPGDARGALGRDSPQQKPDLGRSRTKNNLPAAQEERRAKSTQIMHMSGGESSASIFRDNRGVWCNSIQNRRTAALKSLEAFLGQQTVITPRVPSSIWGRAALPGSWELQRAPVQLCQGETPCSVPPVLPQEAAARAAGSPEKLQTHGG